MMPASWPSQGPLQTSVGATLVEPLRSVGSGHSPRRLQEGVGEKRASVGLGKSEAHRRGHRPTQGHLRSRGAPRQDAGVGFWPARQPKSLPTRVQSGSTTVTGGSAATRPTYSSNSLDIRRLRSPPGRSSENAPSTHSYEKSDHASSTPLATVVWSKILILRCSALASCVKSRRIVNQGTGGDS
jgi:hypothetical protein